MDQGLPMYKILTYKFMDVGQKYLEFGQISSGNAKVLGEQDDDDGVVEIPQCSNNNDYNISRRMISYI